jgi:hypothetical protein
MKPPTPKQVEDYAKSIGYTTLNGLKFTSYYAKNDWRLKGGRPMRNWKLAVNTWHRQETKPKKGTAQYIIDQIERKHRKVKPK